jgi:cell wall assembly regulator SMI1
VDTIWQTIEELIGEPLPAGATAEAVVALQTAVGLPLPLAYLASLARHDGTGSIFLADWRLLSVEETLRLYQALLGKSVVDDYLDRFSWKQGWLPLALDRAGNLMCLNLDPETDSDDDEVRLRVPLDLERIGELFSLWQDENRIVPQYMELEEWLEELTEQHAGRP